MACGSCGGKCGSACQGTCSSNCGRSCGGSCSTGSSCSCTSCTGCSASCRDGSCSSCTGCSGSCQGGCNGGCTSCSGCTSSCSGSCSGGCKSCSGSCSGGCKGGCTSCSGCTSCTSCSTTCTGTCAGTCTDNCNNGCTGSNVTTVYNNLKNGKLVLMTAADVNNLKTLTYNEADRRRRSHSTVANININTLISQNPWEANIYDTLIAAGATGIAKSGKIPSEYSIKAFANVAELLYQVCIPKTSLDANKNPSSEEYHWDYVNTPVGSVSTISKTVPAVSPRPIETWNDGKQYEKGADGVYKEKL